MASLNRVQLIGRLGLDPEMRYTPKGTPFTRFPSPSIAPGPMVKGRSKKTPTGSTSKPGASW